MALTPTLAAVRFGTGLSPDIAPPRDADEMLARLTGPDEVAITFPQPGWETKVATAIEWSEARRARRDGGKPAEEAYRQVNRRMAEGHASDLGRVIARAARTQDGFRERLAWFWADHFTVADGVAQLRRTVAGYHEEAIRPHLAGRFATLLEAAVTHPAMLVYLDQVRSIGPNSRRAQRGGGLNENLAREVLELHTLGVGGTYGQVDVRELAELLTGLGITREGAPLFRPVFAEPGQETVLGRTYGGDPARPEHISRVLEDLSVHPDTARHVSGKLATHFIADVPPADLVQAMTAVWLATGGDLLPVYRAMLTHPAAMDPELRKVRRPLEYVAAAARAFGHGAELPNAGIRTLRDLVFAPLERMGQPWQGAPGPDGWPEDAGSWITPQALAARIDWAMTVPTLLAEQPDPRDFVRIALADLATPRTLFAAEAAEDRAAGIGLILASPEFQRR